MAETTGIETTTSHVRVSVKADSTLEAVNHVKAENDGKVLWTECDGTEFCVVLKK